MWVSKLLSGDLESIALCVSIFVTVLGLIALLLVWFLWPRISRLYREMWAKIGVGFFRFVAAASAIVGKAVPPKQDQPLMEQPWALTTLIAIIGFVLWEFAGAIGDHKYKLEKEKTAGDHKKEVDDLKAAHQSEIATLAEAHKQAVKAYQEETETLTQDRDDAAFQAYRLAWLLTQLREMLSEKLQRIRRVSAEAGEARPSIQQARDGLSPDEQIPIILEWLVSLFRVEVTSSPAGYDQNFRVGLFAEKDGCLVPVDAFDLATRSHDPFTSYRKHVDRYRFDNKTNPSHAIRCIVEGRVLIVPDCAKEPGFEFFEERQGLYLRSMVAYPLANFCPDGTASVRAALLIDTNVVDYFREEDREMIELRLREFVLRIDLEYAIRGLLSGRKTPEGGLDERRRT